MVTGWKLTTSLGAVVVLAMLAFIASSGTALSAGAPAEAGSDEKPVLLILNPSSSFDSNVTGQRVGYSLREKLRRSRRFEMPNDLDVDEAESRVQERPDIDDIAVARQVAAGFDARFLVWGEVKEADGYTVTLRTMDVSGDGHVKSFSKSAATQRELALACGAFADEIAGALTGEGYREASASTSATGYVRVGPNLAANGNFEEGKDKPSKWEAADGLCSFWEANGGRGKCIRFDTDVYLAQWQEWRTRFEGGEPASAAPAKTETTGHKYDTVGGTYGVHLYSDPMPVKPGATYAITFDAKGKSAGSMFFAKVFVKGYGDDGTTEYYNMYKGIKAARPDVWEHYSRIFHPTDRTPQVKTMKVMLYAYWPPGEYAFDNIAVYEVKPEAAPAESTTPAEPAEPK